MAVGGEPRIGVDASAPWATAFSTVLRLLDVKQHSGVLLCMASLPSSDIG